MNNGKSFSTISETCTTERDGVHLSAIRFLVIRFSWKLPNLPMIRTEKEGLFTIYSEKPVGRRFSNWTCRVLNGNFHGDAYARSISKIFPGIPRIKIRSKAIQAKRPGTSKISIRNFGQPLKKSRFPEKTG